MAGIPRAALFGKLNQVGYKSVESATVFCKMRGNPYVELPHWLHQAAQLQNTDLHRIFDTYKVDPARFATDLTRSLDALPRGATAISDFSPHLEEAIKEGWLHSTLLFGDQSVRIGHVLVGALRSAGLRNVLISMSGEFQKINVEHLVENFSEAVKGSVEEAQLAVDGWNPTGAQARPGEASGAIAPASMGKQDAIRQFCKDLTEEARSGRIDPIVGRDRETRQVIDILMRRRQNNPILTGEAGVGKTAVVEGFAHKIVSGDVPPPLRDVRLLELDVAALQAGASMKGEFENRLKQVIEEIRASPKPVVLFIDEAHTLIGAGGSAGTGDAAQLLKPALARGTLRTIAATTWSEYKKHIEKDPALTRRFQVVQVLEPGEEAGILMMRKVRGMLESHHKVEVLDEAVEAAVRLSHRYIPARQLPDKAVSLLDTACARVAIGQHAVPAEVEDARRRIESLDLELEILRREAAVGQPHAQRIASIEEAVAAERARLAELESDWAEEKTLVEKVLSLRSRIHDSNDRGADNADADAVAAEGEREPLLAELAQLVDQLKTLQGERPLILSACDADAVAAVVADWTGIPVGRMVRNELDAVLKLTETLNRRVVGQGHAMEMIARRIQTSRAQLDNPSKPIGVFMLCGPSGVGKTETALALAEALYGGEHNIITINMSEFQEAHTVSTLKGAPPGYVGYGEGGVLTEAVRRRPYSVVLLDEVEKAHPDVHEIFFQVFDKGVMEDGEGRLINFKNTLILLTSNVGSELIMNLCKDPDLLPEPDGVARALRKPLLDVFPAALLGRIVTIPYFPLGDQIIDRIIRLQLARIERRLRENHDTPFTFGDDAVDLIRGRCTELESGGRMIDAVLTNTMLPAVSREILTRMMEGKAIKRVHVGVRDGDFEYQFD